MTYAAKIDWWIGSGLSVALTVPLVVILNGTPLWLVPVLCIPWLITFGLCFPQSYETMPEALVIRAGLYKKDIPYAKIQSLRRTNDSRSSMALSTDRVLIEFDGGALMIASKDNTAFLSDIASRAPQLSRQGLDLVVSFR